VSVQATLAHACRVVVPVDHPAIPGHFPGDPLVPGVVILDRVIEAAEDWLGYRLVVQELPQVKFLAPLRPGEHADVTLALSGFMLSYRVNRGGTLISQGTLRLRGSTAP
jgi:3-hydroxymyristoyl/3-hydroxydecanoyl-(acyl carrier protein) dehydratase